MKMKKNQFFFVNEELVHCYATLKLSEMIHHKDHQFCCYEHEKKDCAQQKKSPTSNIA